ncbi:tetratricopeptide repeat protein [Microbacterium schleiferi]|uniref:Tetratricopeptide repeat protein n=1 Tax=Microbacterium schleiferi TaxID=69362 RepID=A0A7S8MVH7_9MICO|nr:tetratricopeptide repeat protein [Microbacterium schleiferi]QPE03448.1 tetratricopeptide repeat protein [Microbacterium schleiferi]
MDTWEERIAAIWADEDLTDDARIRSIDAVAAERPADDALALFERAGARDAAGRESEAEPLYRAAIAAGLPESVRAQAAIQLASTLRNLGRAIEAVDLLRVEYDRSPQTDLRDEVAAFYALALASDGRPDAAASVALTALAPHLTRYRRSVEAYARELHRERSAHGEHEREAAAPPVDSISRNEHGSTHG